MINRIIKCHINGSLISSNFKNWKYIDVKKNDLLVVINKLFLCSEIFQAERVFIDAASASARGTDENYLEIFNQAKDEFLKTEKIEGFELLNLRILEKCWVSHFDMQNLKNHFL